MKVVCLYLQNSTDVSKLAEYFLRYSPQICTSKEALFVEIEKCKKLYSEESFIRRAKIILQKLQIEALIGIGSNISESLVKAKYGTLDFSVLPLLSILEFTDPFNTDVEGQKSLNTMIVALTKLAIKNIAEFLNIPSKELSSRFGKIGLLSHLRIKNEIIVPWREWQPAENILESKDLSEYDHTGNSEYLLFEIKSLLDQLFKRLWSRGLKAASLKITFSTQKTSRNLKPIREMNFDFISPQSTTSGTLSIIKVRLDRELAERPFFSPLEKFEILVTGVVPGYLSQKNLFASKEDQEESLSTLLNQLTEIHGHDHIFYANAEEDRIPELSWSKCKKDQMKDLNLSGIIPDRPTYLIKPSAIQVVGDKVYIQQKPFKIKTWSEYVERLSGHWLEERIERNYYQVEVENGPILWIFHDTAKNYFLHGYYG